MTDEKFEEFLQQAAQDYNPPPETPRAEMWARIDEVRAKRRGERDLERKARSWVLWAAGIAAVLLLGIGIGRMTVPAGPSGEPGPSLASEPDETSDESASAFHVAAAEYFEATDAFLSLFQTEARAGRADAQVAAWAGDLLTTARLMLDSPVARDPNFRELLEDLELALVQISQYTWYQSTEELELIEQGLDERNVQLRLQAALATGDELTGQGAL
jgi:hypothetical protein